MLGAPARAEPHINWRAPSECPQSAQLTHALHERGADTAALARVQAIDGQIVHLTQRAYQLALSVEVGGRSARRTLSATHCDELLNAAVWLVVLALGAEGAHGSEFDVRERDDAAADFARDSSQSQRGESGKSSDKLEHVQSSKAENAATARNEDAQSTATDARTSGETAARTPPPSVRKRPDLHARIAGFGGVVAGAGAKVQGVIGLWADVSVGAMHTQVTLADMLPANRSVEGGGHVQLWSLALGLSECALWGRRVQAGPCLGIEGLRTVAHSNDFGHRIQRSVLWAAMDLGLQLFWPLTTSLELNLSGGVAIPVTPRPRFNVAGVGAVASAERIAEQAHLGLIYLAH